MAGRRTSHGWWSHGSWENDNGKMMFLQLSYWLVVWNMNFIFPYIGNDHPNWLIFFSGVDQPPSILVVYDDFFLLEPGSILKYPVKRMEKTWLVSVCVVHTGNGEHEGEDELLAVRVRHHPMQRRESQLDGAVFLSEIQVQKQLITPNIPKCGWIVCRKQGIPRV